MTIKLIIFDFDGTIADTYQVIVKIANSLSEEYGYKPFDAPTQELLRDLSSREIIKKSEISLFKLPFLAKRIQLELGKYIKEINAIEGIAEVLRSLKQQNYHLGIVTSNVKANVDTFLEEQNLAELFDFVFASKTIFGKHRIINRAFKNMHLSKDQVIYIGDETRDIRSARKSGVGIISVNWGFHSAQLLQQHQPDFVAKSPADILDAIAMWKDSCQSHV